MQDIDSILQKTGLPGSAVILEITESMLIKGIDQTMGLLTQLSARQIEISIDDFGTGYSSLNFTADRLSVWPRLLIFSTASC